MTDHRFLVTGAGGCIGAWSLRQLVRERAPVVALDLRTDARRARLLLDESELAQVTWVEGDITDLDGLERTVDEHGITSILHLAALQVPFCRADPALGARVNVVGTINVLEAAKRRRDRMSPVVYASSIAAYDALDTEDAPPTTGGAPSTLYGVYKRACEGAAKVYFDDEGVSSLGLRPHTVFGPGRDQGLTSAPTVAMLSAAGEAEYRIPYGGRGTLQYGPDVAAAFIAAARADYVGASVHDLPGEVVGMDDVVEAIVDAAPWARGRIDFAGAPLPFPAEVDVSSLLEAIGPVPRTPFAEAVGDAVERFGALLRDGRVELPAPVTAR
jgi:UDP-glucuronate 4-epimerase